MVVDGKSNIWRMISFPFCKIEPPRLRQDKLLMDADFYDDRCYGKGNLSCARYDLTWINSRKNPE